MPEVRIHYAMMVNPHPGTLRTPRLALDEGYTSALSHDGHDVSTFTSPEKPSGARCRRALTHLGLLRKRTCVDTSGREVASESDSPQQRSLSRTLAPISLFTTRSGA